VLAESAAQRELRIAQGGRDTANLGHSFASTSAER